MEEKSENPAGNRKRSTETLVPQVYNELRRLAAFRMSGEANGQTISPTSLVHEAYLRLRSEDGEGQWENERQFIGVAAEAMRRIMIDRCRAKYRIKRGGNPTKVELNDEILAPDADDDALLAVNGALDELERFDPAAAELVKLKFYVGMTMDEISEATGTPVRSLARQWAFARAWLTRKLEAD